MKTFGTQLMTGQASKFLVTILSAAASGLAIYFGTAKWEPVAVMVIGAALAYLVPNSAPPSGPPAPQPPAGGF